MQAEGIKPMERRRTLWGVIRIISITTQRNAKHTHLKTKSPQDEFTALGPSSRESEGALHGSSAGLVCSLQQHRGSASSRTTTGHWRHIPSTPSSAPLQMQKSKINIPGRSHYPAWRYDSLSGAAETGRAQWKALIIGWHLPIGEYWYSSYFCYSI